MLNSNFLDASTAHNVAFMAPASTRNLVAVENPDNAITKAVDDFFVATATHTSRASDPNEKNLIPSFERQMATRDQLTATITGLEAELAAAKAKADDLQNKLDLRGEPMIWGMHDDYDPSPEPKPASEFRNQLEWDVKNTIMEAAKDYNEAWRKFERYFNDDSVADKEKIGKLGNDCRSSSRRLHEIIFDGIADEYRPARDPSVLSKPTIT